MSNGSFLGDEDIGSVLAPQDCASLYKNAALVCKREKRSQIVTGRRQKPVQSSRVLFDAGADYGRRLFKAA
jgi:hypothetical protein